MSKLNANAFSFVPGRSFAPPAQPQAPPPAPLERPEQTEAPRPPPTISLSIGGPKPVPAPAPAPAPQAPKIEKSTPKPATPKPESGAPSKTFSTDRAKTDTNTIAQEVKNAADLAVLEDLYGSCASLSPLAAHHTH